MEQNQGELTARYYQNMLAVSGKRPFDMGRTIYQMVHHYVEQALERGVLPRKWIRRYHRHLQRPAFAGHRRTRLGLSQLQLFPDGGHATRNFACSTGCSAAPGAPEPAANAGEGPRP